MDDEKESADNKRGEPEIVVYETNGSFEFRIDDATCRWHRRDSEEHSIGGVRWFLEVQREWSGDSGYLSCFLHCGEELKNTTWSCNAELTLTVVSTVKEKQEQSARALECKFSNKRNSLGTLTLIKWSDVVDVTNGFLINDTLVLRVKVEIMDCTGIMRKQLSTFDSPLFSDVTLIVEDKKIYVGMQVLAIHCSFFATLFFGAFSENGAAEVRLSEIVYDEIIDFLKVLYPERKEVDSGNVRYLLKLADRFGCSVVTALCAQYLLKTKEVAVHEKLFYADKYRLETLLEECLCRLDTFMSVKALAKSPDFKNYSEPLLRTLIERLPENDDDGWC